MASTAPGRCSAPPGAANQARRPRCSSRPWPGAAAAQQIASAGHSGEASMRGHGHHRRSCSAVVICLRVDPPTMRDHNTICTRRGLKIRVSLVQLRPWAPLKTHGFSSRIVSPRRVGCVYPATAFRCPVRTAATSRRRGAGRHRTARSALPSRRCTRRSHARPRPRVGRPSARAHRDRRPTHR